MRRRRSACRRPPPAGLFDQQACATCHQAQGGALGPSLAGLFGTRCRCRTAATVVADDAYLRESILNPPAKIVAGYQPVMPTFQGQLDEEQVLQLIAYIKSLKPAEAGVAGGRRAAAPTPAS